MAGETGLEGGQNPLAEWTPVRLSEASERLIGSKSVMNMLRKKRALTPDAVKRLGLGLEDGRIVIPCLNADRNLVSLRFHHLKTKSKWSLKGAPARVLYGMPWLDPLKKRLWICEGETDVWPLVARGENAVTTLSGALSIPEVVYEERTRFNDYELVTAFDSDPAGFDATIKFKELFPETPVRWIRWPADAQKGHDVCDHFASGGTVESLLALCEDLAQAGLGELRDLSEDRKFEFQDPIAEKKDGYWVTRGERTWPLTNFTFELVERIMIDGKESVRVNIKHQGRVYKNIVIARDAWNSKQKFLRELPLTGNCFFGDERDIQFIMHHTSLTEGIPSRSGTRVIGRHENGFFVFPGMVVGKAGPVPDPETVYVENGNEIEKKVRMDWITDAEFKKELEVISDVLPELNEPDVMLPVMGWTFACFFKWWFKSRNEPFPILNITGPPQGGKTTLARIVMRIFGLPDADPLSARMTKFSAIRALSSSNLIPIFVDEYKSTIGREHMDFWRSIGRSVYGGETDFRGRADLTLVAYEYRAPLCIIGEHQIAKEPALLDRTVIVKPNPSYLLSSELAKRAEVVARKARLEALAPRYMTWIAGLAPDAIEAILDEAVLFVREFSFINPPIRIVNNVTRTVFGLLAWREFLRTWGLDFDSSKENISKPMYETILRSVQTVLESEGTVSPRPRTCLDDFLEVMSLLAIRKEITEEHEYLFDPPGLVYFNVKVGSSVMWRFQKEIQSDYEVVSMSTLLDAVRENFKNKGYVKEVSALTWFGKKRTRAFSVDLREAERDGLDVGGLARYVEQEEARKEEG